MVLSAANAALVTSAALVLADGPLVIHAVASVTSIVLEAHAAVAVMSMVWVVHAAVAVMSMGLGVHGGTIVVMAHAAVWMSTPAVVVTVGAGPYSARNPLFAIAVALHAEHLLLFESAAPRASCAPELPLSAAALMVELSHGAVFVALAAVAFGVSWAASVQSDQLVEHRAIVRAGYVLATTA